MAAATLSNRQSFVAGQMSCVSLRPISSQEVLILALPGGPGLGGDYLQPFLAKLAEATSLNVALLDLPNHGRSVIDGGISPLNYPGCLNFIESAAREIRSRCGGIILYGQSFGARLAVDLLAASEVDFLGAALTGLPARFESSNKLTTILSRVDLEAGEVGDEGAFARNWRKILPLYTAKPLSADLFEGLASGTKWTGNERMLDDVPPIESLTAKLMKRAVASRILIVQGSDDLVLPDGNSEALSRFLPTARIREIPEAGHFVMVEKPGATLAVISEFIGKLGHLGA